MALGTGFGIGISRASSGSGDSRQGQRCITGGIASHANPVTRQTSLRSAGADLVLPTQALPVGVFLYTRYVPDLSTTKQPWSLAITHASWNCCCGVCVFIAGTKTLADVVDGWRGVPRMLRPFRNAWMPRPCMRSGWRRIAPIWIDF